jgi:hypothetical protein
VRFANAAGVETSKTGLVPLARMVREYALARLGRSREKAAVVSSWARDSSSNLRPDIAFWAARTLVSRREYAPAVELVAEAVGRPAAQANPELTWRLRAVAVQAARGVGSSDAAAVSLAEQSRAAVESVLGAHAALYFARPDLVSLRKVNP